jgi:acyl-phosphate glycerol 3-phosphate acyltransferase
MAFWIAGAAGLVIAYLLGAIPAGYLAGKLLGGIDIREHGSRSTGATNVLRTLGKWPALVVLIADVLKGVAAILVARWFCPGSLRSYLRRRRRRPICKSGCHGRCASPELPRCWAMAARSG